MEADHSERVRDDVRLMYELSGSQTTYLKSQQWTSTYYVLITFAGPTNAIGTCMRQVQDWPVSSHH